MSGQSSNPPTYTGGVKPMMIEGRMASERERLFGMSDAERAWRAQWLKDQILAPDEPIVPKNYYQERFNPIRRFYRYPMDCVESILSKTFMGPDAAFFTRHLIAKSAMTIMGIWIFWYHQKYNGGDWTKKSGLKVSWSRRAVFPNDPGYPNYPERSADDYAEFGFKKSPI